MAGVAVDSSTGVVDSLALGNSIPGEPAGPVSTG